MGEKLESRSSPASFSSLPDFGLPSPPFPLGSPLQLSPGNIAPTFDENPRAERKVEPIPSFKTTFRPLKQETFFVNTPVGNWGARGTPLASGSGLVFRIWFDFCISI